MVTLAGLEPGAPLTAAVGLADELDARRVPLTLLAGARPHPEVLAWAVARRRAGDAVLLQGTGARGGDARLPAHEAGLRLAGALRARDTLDLPVDGFAAPGWSTSAGVRRVLGAATLADLSVLVDAGGVHRLGPDGAPSGSCSGPVVTPGPSGAPGPRPWRGPRLRPGRRSASPSGLLHLATAAGSAACRPALLAAVDAALEAGAVPATPSELVRTRPTARRGSGHDPEHWSITA